MARGIYLDNSTTTRPSLKAVSKMMPYYNELWGTPSAPHRAGHELLPSMTESYMAIYKLFGAREIDEFVFTSSGAEAVNQAILSAYFDVTLTSGKNHFLTSLIDEAPSITSLDRLEKFDCVCQQVQPTKNGKVTAESISKMITPRTALISLSYGNGLTGTINQIAEIATLCRERGILLHLDLSHAVGKLYFEIANIDAHFFSFNGDHFHTPKGTGGLFTKAGTRCRPFILGGNEQGGLRAGSFNVANLVALGQAAKEADESRDLLCTEVARLRDKLELGIVAHYPEAIPFYCDQERLPHCTSIAFPGIANEAMLYSLNRKDLFACIGGGSFQQLSQILTFCQVPEAIAQTAVSFSLSRETHEDEIDRAITLIAESANQLRKTWRF
ncbi:MAG: aminotransferase class V-fold PLP-dependent enzyme [Parachlamydiaceae bacterium]|nr:aminotransferase class V-fold PLP-dependent enzyme [Parachlamydiaceae bacterium]